MGNSMEVPQKIKIELPYDPAISLLSICLKKTILIRKDICTPMFITALFTIAKIWKQPIGRWMDKEDVLHIYNGVLAIEKNEILPFVTTWIDFFFFLFLLCWVFVAACGLSLVAASGGYSSLQCVGLLWWLLLLWGTGSRRMGFSSCSTRTQ